MFGVCFGGFCDGVFSRVSPKRWNWILFGNSPQLLRYLSGRSIFTAQVTANLRKAPTENAKIWQRNQCARRLVQRRGFCFLCSCVCSWCYFVWPRSHLLDVFLSCLCLCFPAFRWSLLIAYVDVTCCVCTCILHCCTAL